MNPTLDIRVEIAGETSLLLKCNAPPSIEILFTLQAIAETIKTQTKVIDEVISFISLLVVYDEKSNTNFEKKKLLEIATQHFSQSKIKKKKSKLHEIPVCYDLQFGLDLAELAVAKKMTTKQIVKQHTEKEYSIYALGFLPGFPYCGFVADSIAHGRKATPRLSVPAGSVGIAGKQTGIYPIASPGGWNIIGQVPPSFYPKETETIKKLNMFSIADRVRFIPIKQHEMI